MFKAILGEKLKMSQIFDAEGNLIPVTVIRSGPCVVTQIKNTEKDKYSAIQIGFGEKKRKIKPLQGHFKKSASYPEFVQEIRITKEEEANFEVGKKIMTEIFAPGDVIDVTGITKGKGFAGGIKRHGFKSHPGGHGHPMERRVGSIGSMFPQHVFKGKKLPGRMGHNRKTIKNLNVVAIDAKNNLLFIKGAVPGIKGSKLIIKGK